jgi:ubiquinol-cytochrome c reductase cytochrome c1 subunit
VFTGVKVGDLMRVAMDPKDAAEWFGATPPDLSVTARAGLPGSGADWLYSYLRGFYRDAERPTGWNNTVYPNVGMPHVLWELQGSRCWRSARSRGRGSRRPR